MGSCYWPDGTPALPDVPCAIGHGDTFCCHFSHTCLSNKLCLDPAILPGNTGRYKRGTCTDSEWLSAACPAFCEAGAPGIAILPCGSTGNYCCQGDSACSCKTENGTFRLDSLDTASTIRPAGAVLTSTVTSNPTAIAPTTPLTTLILSSITIPSSTGTTVVYVSGSPTNAASSSSTSTSPPPQSFPSNKTLPIALGVAIPVTLLLVCALSFLYIFHERKKLARQLSTPVAGGLGQQPEYKGPTGQVAGDGGLNAPVPMEQQWYGGYHQPQQVGGGERMGYPAEAGGDVVYPVEAGGNVVYPVEIGGR